ncbi:MAG: DUF2955 domain-containing protein, partial [Sedimenticolaceae bacterium]|nr:DUF2955 domain-containing protein [Sedimenticolaceae bacterium]
MHIQARRVFRLAAVPSLSLAVAYGMAIPLPFLAPLFAFMLVSMPGPPIGLKGLVGLVVMIAISLSLGLLLIPMLLHYQVTALLIVAFGIYLSSYITINMGKMLFGTFMTIGFTLISAAGSLNFAIATYVIQALVIGISVAVICHWIVYPFFPEDPARAASKPAGNQAGETSNWIALRSMIIVMPAYLLVLTNPAAYMAVIMKTVLLSQQSSMVDAKSAGRELLGSTFLAGLCAALFWVLLKISPNLWMFFLWMLLFSLYFSSKVFGLIRSRYPASFWLNVAVTMLILLGPAVEDSANGKDVYAAFFSRMALFILVTFYAWAAVELLERLRLK